MNSTIIILNQTTNSTPTPTPINLSLQNFLNGLDNWIRVLSFLAHVLYFVVVLAHKELRVITLFLMHHTNITGLMFAVNYLAWMNQSVPNISDPILYKIVCSLAESAWVIIKFARSYSILVLSLVRFIAVYRINLYKRIAYSYAWTFAGSIFAWLAGTLVFLIAKFAANTTYAAILCSDGYSPIVLNSAIYYILVTTLGYIIPIILVIVLFILVRSKLEQMSKKLNKRKSTVPTTSASKKSVVSKHDAQSNHNQHTANERESKSVNAISTATVAAQHSVTATGGGENRIERTLAFQFAILNVLELISAIALTSINISLFIPNFNITYYYWRQILRIINNIAQLFIPIISLVMHPFKFKMPFIIGNFSRIFNCNNRAQ